VKIFKVEIKGISNLIWNIRQREMDEEKKELKANELDEWEEKNWRRKAKSDAEGKVWIPMEWLKMSMIGSSQQNRLVPHFAKSRKETYSRYLETCMIEILMPTCNAKDLEPYGAYVNVGTKQRPRKIWTIRPMMKNWACEFLFRDVFGRMKLSELKEIIEFSGFFIGIGDNRKNNFGRFEVVQVEETTNEKR